MNRVSLGVIAASVCLSVAVLVLHAGRKGDGSPDDGVVARAAPGGRMPAKGGATAGGAADTRAFSGGRQQRDGPRAAGARESRASGSDRADRSIEHGSGPLTVVVGEGPEAIAGLESNRRLPALERVEAPAGDSKVQAESAEKSGPQGGHGGGGAAEGNHAKAAANPSGEKVGEVAANPDPAETTPDENGVILDLPLDGSEDPKRGQAPAVSDGVSFDGDGAYFAADAQLAIPHGGNIDGEGGTILFWIKPDWAGKDPINVSFVQLREPNAWANRLQIFKNGSAVRFIFTPDEGTESGAAGDISGWQPGDWHMVAATWGDGVASLYVDGNLVGSQEYQGQFQVNPKTPLLIGSDYKPNYRTDYGAAGGAMSGVKVYNRPLGPDEIFEATADVPQQ